MVARNVVVPSLTLNECSIHLSPFRSRFDSGCRQFLPNYFNSYQEEWDVWYDAWHSGRRKRLSRKGVNAKIVG
jgi:hypothetical protein